MIELKNVHKAFGDNRVLRGLDLVVDEGEVVVILGRSGTGKSVTLKHIVGLLQPDKGEIEVAGRSVVGAPIEELRHIRRDVAYMFQTGALVNWMTVRENVALPLVEGGEMSRGAVDDKVAEALESVGLTEAADLLPGAISGGMRKRAALCRVLVLEPKAILYDEPTAGLDPIMARTVARLMRDVQETHGCAAIVVTHDLALTFRVAHRIGLHDEGRLVEVLPPDEFRRSDHPVIRDFIADALVAPGGESSPGPRRMNTRNLDVLLGLLFFTALIALGVVTVLLSDFAFSGERYDVEMISPDVGYLRPGDPVLVDGMPSGEVQVIERLPEPRFVTLDNGREVRCAVRIEVRMDLDLRATLFEGSKIVVEDRGVLGGRMIRVLEGDPGELLDPDATLVALSRPPVVQAVSDFVADTAADVQATFANLRSASEDISAGRGTLGRLIRDEELYGEIESIAESFGTGADRFADLTASFDAEGDAQGTLGKLINDPTLYDTALAAFEDVRGFTGGDGSGEGTLKKLVNDPTLYDTVLAAFEDIQAVARDVRDGDGTLARIVDDPALYDSVKKAFDDIGAVVDGVQQGKGLLGAALNDEAFSQQARDTMSRIAAAADDVGAFTSGLGDGNGLLSLLVNDEAFAKDVREIVSQALSGLEDARETAPVQGVGGLLFGTF